MPAFSRIVSIPLRTGELAFGAVITGVIGSYTKGLKGGTLESRFIYIIVVAGISILLGLMWLLPFSGSFFHWPADMILSFAWFAAFGLVIDYADKHNCTSNPFALADMTKGGACNIWRISEAFSFLSACFWVASGFLGIWFMSRARKERAAARTSATAASKNGVRCIVVISCKRNHIDDTQLASEHESVLQDCLGADWTYPRFLLIGTDGFVLGQLRSSSRSASFAIASMVLRFSQLNQGF